MNSLIEVIKKIVICFLLSAGGVLLCATVFVNLFAPEFSFDSGSMWRLVVMAALSSLTSILFYSKKEIGKRDMLIRQIISAVLVMLIVIGIAYRNDWIETDSILQLVVFALMILSVYALITWINYQGERKLAERMNAGLKKFRL